MKTFTNLEEMEPYYNENNNTYEFIENQKMIDVEFDFNLISYSDITAGNIKAWNITARNIEAEDIVAENINAKDINAEYINAWNIKAYNIKASNINANNINANSINAKNIEFYAVCFSYENFVCNTIKGRRKNSKYFCLDSDVVINKKED